MPKLIVEKNGFFSCSLCGGSDFVSREDVMRSFNCDECPKYQKDGLKIIDQRGLQELNKWFKC